jgi:hypothetical protein
MPSVAIYVDSIGETTASGTMNIYNAGPSFKSASDGTTSVNAYGHLFKDLFTKIAGGTATPNQLNSVAWSMTGLSPATSYDLDAYITRSSTPPGDFFDAGSDAIYALSVNFTTTAPAPSWYDNTITTSGRVGYYYSSSIGAYDTDSYSWSGLPSGITASGSSISGVPTSSGNYSVSYSATGPGGTINASSSINVAIAYPTWTDNTVSTTMRQGTSYNDAVSASNVSYYGSSGTIPPGLSFNTSNGSFSGTPTTPGSYTFSFAAYNANGEGIGTSNFTATVKYPLPVWIDQSVSQSQLSVGQSYSDAISSSNSALYNVVGTLPTGVSLNQNSGIISGTATAAGTFSFSIRSYNGSSEYISTQTFSIQVIDVGGRAFIYDGSQWLEKDLYTYTGSWSTRGTVYYYDGSQWQKSLET